MHVPRSLPFVCETVSTVPPCASTSSLTSISPSPTPPYLRVLDMSPCRNAPKRCGIISGLIPTPVSCALSADSPRQRRVHRGESRCR
eukprot:1889232-Rhodomonas_salina.1